MRAYIVIIVLCMGAESYHMLAYVVLWVLNHIICVHMWFSAWVVSLIICLHMWFSIMLHMWFSETVLFIIEVFHLVRTSTFSCSQCDTSVTSLGCEILVNN